MVIEYASLRGTLDGMDPTAITELAYFFERELGYDIPPMTPFVGANFNITRAGIHADGLMKDKEIYNIFDTEKILNRPATVGISNTSGLAGLAYWMNVNYTLEGADRLTKQDEIIVKMKDEVDKIYADGRTTLMGDLELEELANKLSCGKYPIKGSRF
jgi:isopropylmalate/homocitrate/citramalate synthase